MKLFTVLIIMGVAIGPACTGGKAPAQNIHESSPERESLGLGGSGLGELRNDGEIEYYARDEITELSELEVLMGEVLSPEKVMDLEYSRSDLFRGQLNLINRSLLALVEQEKYTELTSLVPHYMASINSSCDLQSRDCEVLIIFKQDHYSHRVFFELAKVSQSGVVTTDTHWSQLALMSYITQVGDLSRDLQEFLILHSSAIRTKLFAEDHYLQSVFFRALTVITQTLGTENTDAIGRLSRNFEPWLYQRDDSSELNRIRRILWPLWAQSGELSESIIQQELTADSDSIANLREIIPSYSFEYFQIESTDRFDLCLFSLDRIYRGILDYSDLDHLWSRSSAEVKAQCLQYVESYLSQRLIIESLQSADRLLEVLTYVKTQVSSSSFIRELQNKLRPTRDSIVSLRESFSRVQNFTFRILLPPSVTRYDEIEKKFLSLSKNLKMFIEYPAIIATLYNLKDIKQTSLNAQFQLIEVNAEKLLTEFVQGFGMPILELGLDEGSYRYPSRLEFMHSFAFGLGTGFFERLEVSDNEIYKFVINHYAVKELNFFEEKMQFFKDANSSHKYYSLAPFCHAEYDAFVQGEEVESSDYLIYLSNLDAYTYTETNNGLLVINPYQQRFNEYLANLRVDASKYLQFRKFLRIQLSQVAAVKSQALPSDAELGVNGEIYRIHKEAINYIHDTTVKAFECYSAIQNIEVKRRLHIMWFEYLHFTEVHRAMTAMAAGSSYEGYREIDRLGLAPHLTEFTRNIYPDRYRLNFLEMNLRYAHYLAEGSELAARQLGRDGSLTIKPTAKIDYGMNRFSESEKARHQWIEYHPDVNVFIERAFNSSFTKLQRSQEMITWVYKLPNESNLYYLMKTLFELHLTSDYFNNEEFFYKDTEEKLAAINIEEIFEKISVIYKLYSLDSILPKSDGVPTEEKLMGLAGLPQFFEDFRDNITRYQRSLTGNPNLSNGILSYFVRSDGIARYPYEFFFSRLMAETRNNPLWIELLQLEVPPEVKSPEGLSEVSTFYRSIVQMDGLFIPLNQVFEEDMIGFYNRLSHHRLNKVQEAFCHAQGQPLIGHSFMTQPRSDLRISLLEDIHALPNEDIDPEQLGVLRGWSADFFRVARGFLVTESAISEYMLEEPVQYPVCQ